MKILWAAALLVGLLPLSRAQSPVLSTNDLYIGFLSTYGHSIDKRTTGQAARRLDILPWEVPIVNQVAAAFLASQKSLKTEARRYFSERGGARDDVAARSFSQRREALAVASFRDLKERLSAESYAALESYLGRFAQSATVSRSNQLKK